MDTYRFNQQGIDGIKSKKHNHRQYKFDNAIEKQIVDIEHLHVQEKIIDWDSLVGHYVYWQAFLYMT